MELIELGSILHMEKGKKPLDQQKSEMDGYLPYVDIKAFEKGIIDNYASVEKSLLCEDGDLLIVCDGSRSGLTGRAIKGVVGSTLSKIYADGVDTEYLRYFIQSKYIMLNTKKKGTGTPHLNAEILKKSKLIVPTLKEQQHIVSKIEELFSFLDKAEETLNKIKGQIVIYRHSVLKDAFGKFKEKKKIRDMSIVVTSGSRGWAQYYADEGARFIRIKYVKLPDCAEGKRSRLKPNDVLVSITADLGSIALIPENIPEAYINQHIAMIRFINPVQGKFMSWYLKSDYGQKDLLKNKRGGGKLGLGLDDIRDTFVPIVENEKAIETVKEIDARLSACENIEKTIDTIKKQIEAMRHSILKDAFEGRFI